MSFREIPPFVQRVLDAARRTDPRHGLFITYDPDASGPAWEYRPYKRWLILRSDEPAVAVDGVACSLLAKSAWLGRGPTTSIPEALQDRYNLIRQRLEEVA
jgi:hypothetical protein